MTTKNIQPEMDGHYGADAQEESFDLSQRLAPLSVNDLKVHIDGKKGDNV